MAKDLKDMRNSIRVTSLVGVMALVFAVFLSAAAAPVADARLRGADDQAATWKSVV